MTAPSIPATPTAPTDAPFAAEFEEEECVDVAVEDAPDEAALIVVAGADVPMREVPVEPVVVSLVVAEPELVEEPDAEPELAPLLLHIIQKSSKQKKRVPYETDVAPDAVEPLVEEPLGALLAAQLFRYYISTKSDH